MEEFDDEEFYADVVVQASSAISAMHRLTEGSFKISGNATGGDKGVRDRFNGAEVAGGNNGIHENDAGEEDGGGGLAIFPMESGDMLGSESEDDLDSGNDDIVIEKEKKQGGIDGNEKSVKGGDYNSQGKSLKYGSSKLKKRTADEMACNMQKSFNKADANMGDREPCFRKVVEDNQSNFGRKHVGPNKTSERPLDLDKWGSVQISDSVEDNHREVSDSDSDRMTDATETSYDKNSRKAISISNKVSLAAKSESSESSWSRYSRGPSCSPSPSIAVSEKSIEKSQKQSKYPSSSLARESHKQMTYKHYPSKDFKSHEIRQSTSYDRRCVRQRGNSRNLSNQHDISNVMRFWKNRQTGKDASYAVDVKHHYNRQVGNRRQKAVVGLNSYENNVPYCRQSERFVTYSGGLRPDHQFESEYLKNQYWNSHPSCRYAEGFPFESEPHKFHQNRSRQMDFGALEDDWYRNQRRHPVRGDIEGSRRFTPKYSYTSVNQRGSQFLSRRDDMHFSMRTKGDYSTPLDEYDKEIVERKYRRICRSGGRDRDHHDPCDQNIARNRRDMESSGMGNITHNGPRNNSNYLAESTINNRRNIKHWSSPFYSSEEPRAHGRGHFLGTYGPEPWIPERESRCSWKGMHIESSRNGTNAAFFDTRESLRSHHSEDHHVKRRHFQKTSSTYFVNESIKDDHDEDNFVRSRYHQHSEVLHSREEVYKSRQRDDTEFQPEEPSYRFEKTSRTNRAEHRHAFDRAKLIDVREANRERPKVMREQDSSDQIDGYRKSSQPHSHAQVHPRYQDSVDHLVVMGRKCTMQPSRRTSEAEEDKCYGKHDLMGRGNDQNSKRIVEDLVDFGPDNSDPTNKEKVDTGHTTIDDKKQASKFSENKQDESLDIEEGQIITEEIQDLMKHEGPSENAPDGNEEVRRLDDEKILKIMVRMERRRERFKEPITIGRDSVKTSTPLPVLDVEIGEAKLERPARKRRWGGT